MPSGWVLVLGMHRSGTSAITKMFHGFGLSLPVDLMEEREDNPAHYESISLTEANDGILGLLGGSWDAPPALPPGWERQPDLSAIMEMVAKVAAAAFPQPGVGLWKDPRNSLLLPYWQRLLAPIAGIVLPWREPVAAAKSLAVRDGIPVDRGLELWRRYNESALRNSRGYDVFVANYDDLVDDPTLMAGAAADWLQGVIPGWRVEGHAVTAASALVSPDLRHERCDGEALPAACEALKARLVELRGGHRDFDAGLEGFATPAHEVHVPS